MSKLRTLAQLQDALDSAFAWRFKEIVDLKASVNSDTSLRKSTLIRAGVPLLYAHWEGFVKQASEIFLEFVESQRLKYDELTNSMVAFGARRHLKILFETRDPTAHLQAIEFFRNKQGERASFPGSSNINTRSNLNSEVFAEIAGSLGLSLTLYEAFFNFMDESLLKRRNSIAHGDHLDLNSDQFRHLADEVLKLLRSYKTDLENFAAMGSYKLPLPAAQAVSALGASATA